MDKMFADRNALLALALLLVAGLPGCDKNNKSEAADDAGLSPFRSPFDVAYSPNGEYLAVSDGTKGLLYVVNPEVGEVLCSAVLNGTGRGVAWRGNDSVLVSEYDGGTVAEIDPANCRVERRIDVGPKPLGLAVEGNTLLVVEWGLSKLQFVNLSEGVVTKSLGLDPLPRFVDITPDGKTALVGHMLPFSDATKNDAASTISVVSISGKAVSSTIKLPFGASNLQHIKIDSDGKWAYAVHTLGRVNLPTIQLTKGWVNSNAMTIVDLSEGEVYTTVLLDRMMEGAADPFGIALAPDDSSLWVSVAGTRQAIRVDLTLLHSLLDAGVPADMVVRDVEFDIYHRRKAGYYTAPLSDIWFQIKADPEKRALLKNDLGALWGAGVLSVHSLGVDGPRGIAVSPDGGQVAVGAYFTGDVVFLDESTGEIQRVMSLGTRAKKESPARQGERLFHDATTTFQYWLSCATCHPEGRSDGLNWDLLNDGIGNSKNSKSLVYSPDTPPMMSHGVRDKVETAINAGFRFIKFAVPEEEQLEVVREYLGQVSEEASPYRKGDELSAKAQKGKKLFDGSAECNRCHFGPYLTDLKMYDVGTQNPLDSSAEFDNPTLLGLWHTGPYLHDGSAATLMDVLTTKNAEDKHGKTSHLSETELDQLVVYMLELDDRDI